MALRLIYGRAGSGKSEFCFNEITKKSSLQNPVYIITPEQFSYMAEKKLLESVGTNSVITSEVISFNRMAYRVFLELGGATEIHLSKAGKAMIIKSILDKQKKNLKFLGNSNENIDLVLRTITELKKHDITSLDEQIENVNNEYLKLKLTDINDIYKTYEDSIANKYIDEDDVLTLLAKKINKSEMFENSNVYIDEFAGFTEQEYKIIIEILKKANNVSVTICADSLKDKTNPDTDIFYSNKQTANKLIKYAKEADIEILEPVELKELYRYKNSELIHMEKNLYSIPYEKYDKELKNINLFLAANPYTEIENVAKNIIKLVRDENFRFRDISIITKNVDSYMSIAKAVFAKHEIPLFIDEKSDLSKNILIKYVLSILEIFSKNWSHESMFNYIKSGFINIEKNDIYKLENYCTKFGIRGSKWQNEWKTDDQNLNELRKKIANPLLKFKQNLEGTKTAKELTTQIYNFLEANNVKDILSKKIQSLEESKEFLLANEYKTSFEILIDILDEIVLVFQDDKMTFEKYKEILKTGLKFSKLGMIPEVVDQVMMGDVDRSRSHKVKAIFILGLNDGAFPSVNTNEGFLNDKDREVLKEMGTELAKGTLESLYEDQFNIYKALTISEEKLYLSYTSSDKEGKALRPSILISKIKKMFINLKEESDVVENKSEITTENATFDELLLNLRNFQNGEDIDKIWFEVYNWYSNNEKWKNKLTKALAGLEYTNVPEKINNSNIEKLYGDKIKTSVSRLEQYRKCPFSFYLKYGLKIEPKEEFEIKALDTGSFMHEIIDTFFETIDEKSKDDEKFAVKKIQSKEIESILNDIIEAKLSLSKNYKFTSASKFVLLTKSLKKVILQSIQYIIYQLQNSDFNVLGNEMNFTKEIENIELTGKIDRVDIAENENGKFIRVIDYKSSIKKIDLNEILAGVQIQLLTYIDALSKEKNAEPAGIFYFNLIDPIISSSKNLTDEEIEEKIKKEFRMNGLILADVNVIKMMDIKLTNSSSSDIIPVKLDKEGNISNTFSNVVTKEEFSALQKTINKIIKQISKEILSGNIEIKPTYNAKTKTTACKYCEYKAICGFNPNENSYSYIDKKSQDKILEKIKGEV